MPRDVARDALYNGRINLWVEDELTRAYLGAVWNDPAVKYLIGGSRDGVGAILKDAEDAGYSNVFGLIDRDFDRSNYRNWSVPGRTFRRFIAPRHEIENYLLDTAALEGCRFNTHRRSAAEIDSILDAEAARRCWWAACRTVVSLIRDRFFDRFVTHPTVPGVETEAEARAHITQSDWFRSLPRRAAGMTDARIHRLLLRAHSRAETMRRDGRWRVEFSGKEFLRVIGNRIFNRAVAPRTYTPTPPEFDADLAKEVAAWQVANNSIPAELVELLAALKARVAALPPAP